MEFFDAPEELHAAIESYINANGELPEHVLVSPFLYQWLTRIQKEENFLQGTETEFTPGVIHTEFGNLNLVIDEALDDFEILAE